MSKQLGTHDGSEYVREAYAHGWQKDAGCFRFTSCTTPEGRSSNSTACVPAPIVVPVIFVPGIMGSNLKSKTDVRNGQNKVLVKSNQPTWRVDNKENLASEWLNRKQDQYQLRFQADKVTSDDRGAIPVNASTGRTSLAGLPEALARARGWGTVSAEFYGGFLDWLDKQLNGPGKLWVGGGLLDNAALATLKQTATKNPHGVVKDKPGDALRPAELDILLKADNPVHAFGYNWLQSNGQSGKELAAYIEKTIAGYNQGGRNCKHVILVTHSMGGLVARAACQLYGAASNVAGVFHGVMPTDGAAATYKRMVSGFGGEPTNGLAGWIKDWVGAQVLGPTGDYATPSLALNAGPLELLPNARYNQGRPWLSVKDKNGKQLKVLPTAGDPYAEIYLEKEGWWRLLNPEWLNPSGLKDDLEDLYGQAVIQAKKFHIKVQTAGDYHPNTHAHYGVDSDHLAYGTITWKLSKEVVIEHLDKLQRDRGEFPLNVAPKADMHVILRDADHYVLAQLSDPDVPGDGTVPAAASAMAVDKGVQKGHLLARGTGYSHDASYDLSSTSEGPWAALQSIVRVLNTPGVIA